MDIKISLVGTQLLQHAGVNHAPNAYPQLHSVMDSLGWEKIGRTQYRSENCCNLYAVFLQIQNELPWFGLCYSRFEQI